MDNTNKNQFEKLTDFQWEQLKDLFPTPAKRGRGKPHTPWRTVLNSVLYILFNHVKWGSWPQTEDYASKSAAHRWFLIWDKTGLIQQALEVVKSSQAELKVFDPQRRTHAIREVEEEKEEMPLYLELQPSIPATPIYHP